MKICCSFLVVPLFHSLHFPGDGADDDDDDYLDLDDCCAPTIALQ